MSPRLTDIDPEEGVNNIWTRINFKRIVRKVIIHRHWLTHDIIPEDERTRASYKDATIAFETRVALMKDPNYRTDEEITMIANMLLKITDLANFTEKADILHMANYVTFQVFDSGRIIIHANHIPEAMYAMISGNAQIFIGRKSGMDDILEKQLWSQTSEGNCFGAYELFMDQIRVFTVKALTRVELIVVPRDLFQQHVYPKLSLHFNQIRSLIQPLHYFNTYDAVDLNQICFFGDIYTYKKDEILVSPQLLSNDTFIVINGRCDVIETLYVRRQKNSSSQLELRDVNANCDYKFEDRAVDSSNTCLLKDKLPNENNKELTLMRSTFSDYVQTRNRSSSKLSTTSIHSCVRLSNQSKPGPASSIAALFQTRPSKNLLRNVEKHYMKIASYSSSACFNVGENLRNRIIICTCATVCLLIPQHYLAHHHSNVWEKVRQYLDKSIPNTLQIYKSFIKARQFRSFKKDMVNGMLQTQRIVPSKNRIANVPFSLRLRYDYEFTDQYHHELTASDFNIKHRKRQSYVSRESL